MRELGPMNAQAPQFPLAAAAPAPLRARAESLGNGDFSPLWAGQNASGCREIGAGELTSAGGAKVGRSSVSGRYTPVALFGGQHMNGLPPGGCFLIA